MGDILTSNALASTAINRDELIDGVLGALLAEIRKILPDDVTPEGAKDALERGPAKHIKSLQRRLVSAVEMGVLQQADRMERSFKVVRQMGIRAGD